jgi:hypothetical protein
VRATLPIPDLFSSTYARFARAFAHLQGVSEYLANAFRWSQNTCAHARFDTGSPLDPNNHMTPTLAARPPSAAEAEAEAAGGAAVPQDQET